MVPRLESGGTVTVLLVAAEPREFRGILARAHNAKPAAVAADWARLAAIGGETALLVANGAGAARAAAAVDAACDFLHPDRVVSTGFAGALDPALGLSAVVVATSIRMPGSGEEFPALPVCCGAAFISGAVCTVDHIAGTAAQKAALFHGGAIAVEMEAAGVAARARARGLPFHCVRAITDLANENLANDFQAVLRPDGHFGTIAILRAAFRHPRSRLPELVRFAGRSDRAALALGDFFANCRF
jgi:adenosylhomocysteine nucleosidase